MKKRSWWIDKKHVLHCYSSPRADCRVPDLKVPKASEFYDAALGQATEELNGHLRALAELRASGMELSVIIVEGAPFLAWTQPTNFDPDEEGVVGPDAHPDTIREALRLDFDSVGGRLAKRTYYIGEHYVWCFKNPKGDCLVSRFWGSLDPDPGSFHDAELAETTWKINDVLDGLRNDSDPSRALSLIAVDDGFLLAWTRPGVGSDDEPHVIREALGLSD